MATYDKGEDLKKNQGVVVEPTSKLNGVDEATQEKISNPSFTASDTQQNAQNTANAAKDRVQEVTSKNNIVSGNVWNTLNSSFAVPEAVKEADTWISSQLQKIQSGKTSYSDQVKDMMAQIQGREKFSYDVDSDPLFQQALSSAMSSGKQAMQDTIGQASALTGGYGSTYATTAGNQAYNAFIEDAYDNLPQYYQMAMEAYQMEGDEMYRQLDMLSSADDKEYNRNITAYDATYQHRNQMYNESYQLFRDSKTDAYNMANLQLSEHGQLVSDAVNNYNVSSDYANTLYGREYQQWSDSINQAMQYAQMQNNNWWNATSYNEGIRQYEKSFDEQQRQYNNNYEQTEKWNQEEMDYKKDALTKEYTYKDKALKQDNDQWEAEYGLEANKYKLSTGDTNGDGILSEAELENLNKMTQDDAKSGYVTREVDGKKVQLKLPSESQNAKALEAWNKDMEANDGNLTEFNKYLDSLSGVDEDTIQDYVATHGFSSFEERTFTKITDSPHGFLGLQNLTGAAVDQGDIVEDEYGNKYDLEDLAKLGLPEEFLEKLTGLKEGKSYKKTSTSKPTSRNGGGSR